ncbi:MAG TPA: CDP-alcohol phosphatidyltransferase family protein [Gaiellaceae bacterium]|nr:CDP-alcohol phosphatidyltransferase family protein [Gaiellaceae bacterium]
MSLDAAPTPAAAAGLLARSRKQRPVRELLCEHVFRPLAHPLVLALLPLRVPPPAVVAASAAAGVATAVEIGRGQLVLAALLLQLKTVLDNADGQLARLSGRVSVLGRYLDSESDLIVDAALLAAIGYRTGRPGLAAGAFVVLTFVLSVDFNLERLYRASRGDVREAMPHGEGRATALCERLYALVYAPQDRLVERVVEWRLAPLAADGAARLAYHDRATIAVLANTGLSTQLAALGLFLALGEPTGYCWFVFACALALVPLFLRRELLARRSSTTRR